MARTVVVPCRTCLLHVRSVDCDARFRAFALPRASESLLGRLVGEEERQSAPHPLSSGTPNPLLPPPFNRGHTGGATGARPAGVSRCFWTGALALCLHIPDALRPFVSQGAPSHAMVRKSGALN